MIINCLRILRALLWMRARKPGDSVPVNLMPVSEILLLSQTHTGAKFPLTYAPQVTQRECGWENVDYVAKISFYHGENTLGAKEDLGIFSWGDCGTTQTNWDLRVLRITSVCLEGPGSRSDVFILLRWGTKPSENRRQAAASENKEVWRMFAFPSTELARRIN